MATTLFWLCAVLLAMVYLAFAVLSGRWVWKLTHGETPPLSLSLMVVATAFVMVGMVLVAALLASR